jgi:hypothetical protein
MTMYRYRWAHIAVTVNANDANNVTFYINGQDAGSGTFTLGPNTGATMTIGNSQSETAWAGSPEVFNGQLDEVRIYNRALSAAEIAYLADLTPADGKLQIPVQRYITLSQMVHRGSISWTLPFSRVIGSKNRCGRDRHCMLIGVSVRDINMRSMSFDETHDVLNDSARLRIVCLL